jgi:hypothetical protein
VNKLTSHYRVKLIDKIGFNLTIHRPTDLRKEFDDDFCLGHDCKSWEIIQNSILVGLIGTSGTNYSIQRWWLTSTDCQFKPESGLDN